MDQTREDRIRARAHEIWEREGRPEGCEAEHWRQAEREIDAAEGSGGETAPSSGAGAAAGEGGSAPDASTGASGLASGLQPSGMSPSASPAAGVGSLGTGGGSTAGKPSGTVNR